MPAWWRGKSKSSPKDKDKDKDKDKSKSPSAAELRPREKAKSFDEVLAARRRAEAAEVFSFDSDADRRGSGGGGVGHPLPRPAVAASASLPHEHGSAGASASVSSVSSSGSSEETPDLGVYRYSEPVNTPRGRSTRPESQRQHHLAEERNPLSCSPVLDHDRVAHLSTSPRSGFHGHSSNTSSNGSVHRHYVASTESVFNPGSRSPGPRSPRSQGYTFPATSPNSRGFGTSTESPTGKYNDLRSPPHPLPLPPGSPTSPASRPLQSKWKKGRLLGRGTFGHVYEGFNSESGQMCAIKEVEIISDDSNSKECLRQLAQEINLLSQLSHPNIVQYYGSELVGDALSVYLEYVSGGSIHKLLQEYGPFKEPVIRSYARQILSGLAYLHGRNTFHRDIKGANILVDPIGEIKLADFGMAKHISSFASIRSFKGSPYWMAPEVIMNTNGYNLSVDIWSLGCTIIEMATAKPPWSQFTGVQAIFKIGNSKDIPDIPEHLSDEGKRFLKLCLQRDPSNRPTAAQLLDHPFVRDNTKVKVSLPNLIKDPHPSPADGSRSPTTLDFGHNSSISPLQTRDLPVRQMIGGSPTYRNQSDAVSLRMNMSLPVSPCSSPLRQFRQSNNRSCLPSPPHPAYMIGSSNYGPSNYTQYPLGASSRYNDLCADIYRTNGLTPYGSPRS